MEHLVGVDFTSVRVLDSAVKSSKGVIARRPRDFSSRVVASVRFSAQNMRVRIRILMAQTQQTGAGTRPVAAHTQERRQVRRRHNRVWIYQSHV